MTPEVERAITELRATFDTATVTAREDGEGGAYVRIDFVDPGLQYAQRQTWIGFRITSQYPYADVYPLFVRPDLTRNDGQELGQGFSRVTFEDRPAIQVSRRSNRLNPASDTAALKVLKVLSWMSQQ